MALWRVYKSGLFNAEYDTVQLLYMSTFPPSGIHYAKQPKTLENLNGLKLATGSKVGADTIERLGGSPLSMITSDYYTAVQRGMVDAVLVQWTAFQPFKLQDVTFYHLETKLGGATGMVFMAKKKYDALPAAVRKILDDNSSEAESPRLPQVLGRCRRRRALDGEGTGRQASDRAAIAGGPGKMAQGGGAGDR